MDEVRDGLYYTESHEWIRVDGGKAVIGMTDHAQQELGTVVYVELPAVGKEYSAGDEVGAMESVKTIEPIYAPISGKVTATNDGLEGDPEAINKSPYDDGWMMEFEMSDASQLDSLMGAAAYAEFTKPKL